MKHIYTHFIPQNIAPRGAKRISVFSSNSTKICTVPLGRLFPVTKSKLYSFGLISDIHLWKTESDWGGNAKFDNALTFFEKAGCDFCTHAGDITQTGLYDEGDEVTLQPAQFENYKKICDNHKISVYGICGNHENYVMPITNNLSELKHYTGTDLYYTLSQGEDLFIFLGQPQETQVINSTMFQWLYQTLESNRNKRCFVFIHSYIEEDSGDSKDVRENSIFEMWGETNKRAFMSLMSHYKNTILFHGHSHMKLKCQELDKNSNYTEKNGFKSVHIPSSATPRDVDLTTKKSVDDRSASEGYKVDVYDDCIVLNGIDFIKSQIIPIGTYKIDTPIVTIEANTFTDNTGVITTYS